MGEVLLQVLKNLFLASWVALSYLLQISWQLANNGILIDKVHLLFNLSLKEVDETCNALFDANCLLLLQK